MNPTNEITQQTNLNDGDFCRVIGTVRDIHMSKTGHVTITVVQENGVRFKTLAKNVTTD